MSRVSQKHVHITAEIVFSIVQRKVVPSSDFNDLDEITERLAAFADRYNTLAESFDCTFTRNNLDRLPQRIADHDPAVPPRPSAG